MSCIVWFIPGGHKIVVVVDQARGEEGEVQGWMGDDGEADDE